MASRNYLSLVLLLLTFITFSQSEVVPTRIASEQSLVNMGDDIIITCHLDTALKIAKKQQVFFYKRQRTKEANLNETISIGFYILESYNARDITIEVRPETDPENTQWVLNIKNAQHKDSGEYGCAAASNTDKNIIEKASWMTFSVKRDVQEILMEAISTNGSVHALKPNKSYRFTQRQNYILRCVAKGSIPMATLDMYIGNTKVSPDLFGNSFEATKSANNVGARDVITYDTAITSESYFLVEKEENVTCKASVDGTNELTFIVGTEFPNKPKVECVKKFAGYLDKNIKLSCFISAFPNLTDYFWNITTAGGLSEVFRKDVGDGKGHFTLEETWNDDVMTSTIILHDNLMKQHFERIYTVIAVNEEGKTETIAPLIHDPNMGKSVGDGGSSAITSSILLLLTASMLWKVLHH